MNQPTIVLYTTVYRAAIRYLPDWAASVRRQTDDAFDICIGVDGLAREEVLDVLSGSFRQDLRLVMAEPGASPASIREMAIRELVDEYKAIVFSDSDDMLEPTRVEAARLRIRSADLDGCAMRLVDEAGSDLKLSFSAPQGWSAPDTLYRHNVFGLSNTTYRSEFLRHCLPVPDQCKLMDWFLALRTSLLGGRLSFDPACRMAYRQHGENMARVLPPFSAEQVLAAARLVREHYQLVLAATAPDGSVRARLRAELDRVELFLALEAAAERLAAYVSALNRLPPHHIWWSCVAHPDLERLWKH